MEGANPIAVDNQLCIEVNQRGSYLFETGQWSDCNFLVGTEAESDRVVIACHKLILSMASPVFEAMFYGDMAEKNDPIPIIDVEPATFMALLEYIYTDKVNINSIEMAYELCYAAKKYMLMDRVERECIKYIWKQIKPSNVCQVYEYALLFEANSLIQKCIQVICMYTKDVLNSRSFLDAQLSTAIAIFSLDYLDVDTELELVRTCIKYAKARDKKNAVKRPSLSSENESLNKCNSPEPSTSNATVGVVNTTNAENGPETCDVQQPICELSDLKIDLIDTSEVRGLIEKIRFLTLSPQELLSCTLVNSTAVLSESERYAIGANMSSDNCDVPMPRGFSTCRIRRHMMVDLGGDDDDEARTFANFRYRIESLSHLTEDVLSPPCYVRNLSWQLKVIPRLSPSQNNPHRKGLILQCNSYDESTNWSCDAKIVIATVHKTGFPAGFKYYMHSFRSESNSLTIPIEWDVLLNPQNEYVTDDAIIFEVRLITNAPNEIDSNRLTYSPFGSTGEELFRNFHSFTSY